MSLAIQNTGYSVQQNRNLKGNEKKLAFSALTDKQFQELQKNSGATVKAPEISIPGENPLYSSKLVTGDGGAYYSYIKPGETEHRFARWQGSTPGEAIKNMQKGLSVGDTLHHEYYHKVSYTI
ncbi:MAG: hypothetical protein WCG23_09755 [bacterium]